MVKKSVDSSGEKIQFRDKLRWIKVEEFGSYQYKHSLTDEEAWKEVCLLPGGINKLLGSPSNGAATKEKSST